MSAETFLQRLSTVFGDPISDDVDGFTAEYLRALRAWPDEVLDAAADIVLKRHAGPHRWPRIRECTKACEEVAEDASRSSSSLGRTEPGSAAHYLAGVKIARRLITPSMAQKAWSDGTFAGLWDFVVREHRLPERKDLAGTHVRCRENRSIMHETVLDPAAAGPAGLLLADLAKAMIEKYEERYRQITGGTA